MFLAGVLLSSLGISFWIIAGLVIFLALASRMSSLSPLLILVLAGSLYYSWRISMPLEISFGKEIFGWLLNIKEGIIEAHRRLLGSEQAAFLSGITIGHRYGFSQNFLERLSLSGTRHVVVLSGSNLTILILIIMRLRSSFLSKKFAFALSFLTVLALVAMTGFEVSAVRASLMAFVFGIATQSERLYSPRNSIALAGLILILVNPQNLVFDIGFQLSFMAILGVAYILPALKNALRIKTFGGLDWREAALGTIAAQTAVAPILIANFSNFTLTSFIANALILAVVPPTMIVGFILALAYWLFYPAAIVLSWLASFLLGYQIFVINIFSRIYLPFNPDLGFLGIAIYYAVVFIFIAKFYGKRAEL